MNIYLDTSSLFKLYKAEAGSNEIESAILANEVTSIYISEITNLEFLSAVLKRVRMNDLSMKEAKVDGREGR